MKTLHTDENTQKAAIESWVLDRIIYREEFVVPFTSHPRVQEIVKKTSQYYSDQLSSEEHLYWMNATRTDDGICFVPVRIEA